VKLVEIRLMFKEEKSERWMEQSFHAPEGYKLTFNVGFIPDDVREAKA